MYIYSYNKFSEGAKLLANRLGAKRIKHEGSRFKGNPNKTVINWGSSSVPEEVAKCDIFNKPELVAVAASKLLSFKRFSEKDVQVPDWTIDKGRALGWLEENVPVMARMKLTGHSGEGIVYCTAADSLPDAPLYVKYKKKKDEYRIHVFQGEVFDVQRKARRADVPDEEVDWKVRNHANGFIYAREGVLVPQEVTEQAVLALDAIGLDFGAVDVIWNGHEEKAYVLEINTAPGLVGTTLERYTELFRGML